MMNKAWAILLEEERVALSLSINHKKSTWEAGEILNKAHYKYLEIHARAKKFFEMFNVYFKQTGDRLIPEDSEIRWDHREFIECIIEERMGYRDTLKKIGKSSPFSHKVAAKRDKEIIEMMEWLRKHPQPLHRELHDLIKEFDRWNNFRVLPESIQEPSAYKRRNKTRLMKHLKNLYSLDNFHIDYLKSAKFKPKKTGKRLYLPLFTEVEVKGFEIVEVKDTEAVVEYLSKELKLYLFKTLEDADDYGHLIEAYMSEDKRTCKTGQKFWPRFRTITKKSANYLAINNIIPRRSNLEQAFRDIDKITIAKQDNKASKNTNDAEDRILEGKFWDV